MELLQDLGQEVIGYDLKGNPTRRGYGIYACVSCGCGVKLTYTRGRTQQYCQNCKGKTHGMAGTRQYSTWRAMVQRCTNPNNEKFHIYGGKGIKVCDKWLTFEGFWEDNKDRYADDLTIDRKDSNKGYDLENTRWITHSKNSSETSKRRPVNQLRAVLIPIKSWELVQQWESAKAAADALGLVAAHITATCQNNRKTHGGFSWQYADAT